MKKILIILLVVIIGLSIGGFQTNVSAAGNTYYVSSSGNDSNSGTESAPWKTLAKVSSSAFSPGDQILFKRGETWTGTTQLVISESGNSTSRITLSSYGTGIAPSISNTSSVGGQKDIMEISGSYITISNLRLTGSIHGLGVHSSGTDFILQNSEVDHCFYNIKIDGTRAKILSNNIHDSRLETPMSDSGAIGILIQSTSAEIAYNTITGNIDVSQAWPPYDGGAIEGYGTISNMYVHHNYFYNNQNVIEAGSSGGSGTGNDILFVYNVMYNNNGGITIHYNPSNAWYIHVTNFQIFNNTYVYNMSPIRPSMINIDRYAITVDQLKLTNNIIYGNAYHIVEATDLGAIFTHTYNQLYLTQASSPGWNMSSSENWGDPQFVDLVNGAFDLEQSSPAVYDGIYLGYTLDYFGNPVHNPPSMGAIEYRGAVPTSTASPTTKPTSTPRPTVTPTSTYTPTQECITVTFRDGTKITVCK